MTIQNTWSQRAPATVACHVCLSRQIKLRSPTRGLHSRALRQFSHWAAIAAPSSNSPESDNIVFCIYLARDDRYAAGVLNRPLELVEQSRVEFDSVPELNGVRTSSTSAMFSKSHFLRQRGKLMPSFPAVCLSQMLNKFAGES